MTSRELTKEYIKVMQHYADGGKIEFRALSKRWVELPDDRIPEWDWHFYDYRIKPEPEPKPRPYANAEEFLKAQKEHGPYIKLKNESAYYIPTIIGSFLFANDEFTFMIGKDATTPLELYENFVFQDGTPCGISE